MCKHYKEASVLELEVRIRIKKRIITNLRTTCLRLLYAEATYARYIFRSIIVREVTTIDTKVNIQDTCYSKSNKEVTISVEGRHREYIFLT